MKEMGLELVYQHVTKALAEENYPVMGQLLWPALDQFPNDPVLLHYAAHLFTVEGKLVPALLCAMKSNELEPTGPNYTNLGSIFRRLNMPEESYAALKEACGYDPKNKHPWNNLAAAYCNEGNPEPGIEAANEALRIDPDFKKARWNRGLLLLEKGDYAQGFDDYRTGLAIGERMMKMYGGEEPAYLESYGDLLKWRKENGKQKPRIVVWGEQGMGDEIMFSTIFPDLAKDADIVFDCHPRMVKIMQDSYGHFIKEIHGTRKLADAEWYAGTEPCQFKCAIGDLARWFRTSKAQFDAGKAPVLKADEKLVATYRESLEELAPGKKLVGFAWTGGIINTQRWYRTAQMPELAPMLLNPDIQPVSLQYEDDTLAVQDFYEKTNKLVYRFPGITTHYDYHHTLALVEALDAVVTVCQSVAHLSAALGKETHVLVPDKAAWRYGLTGSEWYWYGDHAALFRRPGSTWQPAIERCNKALCEYLGITPMEAAA